MFQKHTHSKRVPLLFDVVGMAFELERVAIAQHNCPQTGSLFARKTREKGTQSVGEGIQTFVCHEQFSNKQVTH